jgi:hypothetical protein
MTLEEPASVVLAWVRALGHQISDDQLADSHRRGLIPRPRQVGLGQGKGTASLYPKGTTVQVLALLAAKQIAGRDPERAGWILWNNSYPVDEYLWRDPFREASESLVKVSREVFEFVDAEDTSAPPIVSEAAIDQIEHISSCRNESAMFGPIRRSLGRKKSKIALRNLIEVFGGIFESSGVLQNYDGSAAYELRKIFDKLIGDDEHRSKQNNKINFSIGGIEFDDMLIKISDALAKLRGLSIIDTYSDTELFQARNELNALVVALALEAKASESKGNDISRALRLLSLLAKNITVKEHASLILLWLVARRIPAVQEGLERLKQAAANAQSSAQ